MYMKTQKINQNITIRTLQDIWLSEGESILYMLMLEYPKSTVQELTIRSSFPRTMLYYLLKKLAEKWLSNAKKEKWKTIYSVGDPENLYGLLKNKETEFEKQQQSIKQLIPKLKATFQLKNKRPSVKVYEWLEAYEKILEDSLLKSVPIIYIYEHFFSQKPGLETRENHDWKRVFKKIQKHVLFFETPESLKELVKIPYNDYTLFHGIKENSVSFFKTDVMLYNGKVLYTSYDEHEPTAILIEDRDLYEMQKNIFESLRKSSKDLTLYFTKTNKVF